MLEITHYRNNPLIDPHIEIWEWPIAVYLFLGGLVAGLMILNGVWRLMDKADDTHASTRIAPLWAPVLLSVGMFFLWIDLAYKTHVYNFYLTFQIRSPMSWGAWILILVYPVQFMAIALARWMNDFRGSFRILNLPLAFFQAISFGREKLVAWLNIGMGASLGIYTGILLAAFAARPLWNTALLGPLFLVSGLSTAVAWNMLSRPKQSEQKILAGWDVALIIVEMLLLAVFLIALMTGSAGYQDAGKLLLGGSFTPAFWIFVMILGLALPLWLELREILGKYVPTWMAPILVLIGGLALRLIMVYAGQVSHIPEIEMLSGGLGQ
jgi:formate-dependent nitrite reductase membrane component NrfD